MDKETLQITKKGKLYRYRWNSKTRKYTKRNVTNESFAHLMEPCELAEGVTLKDIFLLIKNNIDVYGAIIGNWVEEYIEEGLSKRKAEPSDLKYLQLKWEVEATTEGKYKSSPISFFPHFNGIGPGEDGEETSWAIEFCDTKTLIDVPVILSKEMTFTEEGASWKDSKTKIYENPKYSLFQILYGIIWELSFLGAPESRDIFKNDLEERVSKLDLESLKNHHPLL